MKFIVVESENGKAVMVNIEKIMFKEGNPATIYTPVAKISTKYTLKEILDMIDITESTYLKKISKN